MDAFEILVLVLAILLGLFLLLFSILMAVLIQVATRIKLIVEKAERVADKVESVTEIFQKTAAPVAIGKLVANMADMFRHRDDKKRKDASDE